MGGWGIYLVYLEGRQIYEQKSSYISFWNMIDVSSTVFVVFFCISDIYEVSYYRGKTISSLAVFFLWLKMFYFLRIFLPTAAFIRMITEVIKDMAIFTLMLFGIFLAFTNAFFILDSAFANEVVDRATGSSPFYAFS
jgi:hypothetical protein